METSTSTYIKGIVESLLFVSEKPITLEQIKSVVESCTLQELRQAADELKQEYEDARRGMVIIEVAGGYQMLSSAQYASFIRDFYKTRVKEKLSKPALEALAIVAYKQPVSRSDIEVIRGVNSDGVVTHLLNKQLIKIVGRKDVPGRPFIYGTTKPFLEYFGLKSLRDLPKLEEFSPMPSETQPALGNQITRNEIEVASEFSEEISTVEIENPAEGEVAVGEENAAPEEMERSPEHGDSVEDLQQAFEEVSDQSHEGNLNAQEAAELAQSGESRLKDFIEEDSLEILSPDHWSDKVREDDSQNSLLTDEQTKSENL